MSSQTRGGGQATRALGRTGPSAAPRPEARAAAERFARRVVAMTVDVGSYAEQRAVRDALNALAAAAVRLPG